MAINGGLALGYGSKYQLLRMLGWHRTEFNQLINVVLNTKDIKWFDFKFNGHLDKELINAEFINNEINEEWINKWVCKKDDGINLDAVGVDSDGTYILVEAKAHKEEIINSHAGGSEKSIELNNKVIEKFIAKYNINSSSILWSNNYYQLANRLVFVDFLLEHNIKVKLLYVLFENGYEYNSVIKKSLSLNAWEDLINKELKDMGVKNSKAEKLFNYIVINCNRK